MKLPTRWYRFDGQQVAKFLDEGPERSVLIGLPGAGKTYALRQAAARCARRQHEDCLAEPLALAHLTVPLFADLKLYTGNLPVLLERASTWSLTFGSHRQSPRESFPRFL